MREGKEGEGVRRESLKGGRKEEGREGEEVGQEGVNERE